MIVITKEQCYSGKDLLARGWTKSIIAKFAGAPDIEIPFRFMGNDVIAKYYSKASIELIEKSDEFIEQFEKSKTRKESAVKAVETKVNAIIEFAWTVPIEITFQDSSLVKITKQAIHHYNERQWDFEHCDAIFANVNSDKKFLARITVNYLRHCRSTYDNSLEYYSGKVGVDEAYCIIKTRILSAIANVFPDLAEECNNQMLTAMRTDIKNNIVLR